MAMFRRILLLAAILVSLPVLSAAEDDVTVGVCGELQTYVDKLAEMTPEFPKIMCVPSSHVANELKSGVLLMIKGDSLIFSGPDINAKQCMFLTVKAAAIALKHAEAYGLNLYVTDGWLQKKGSYFAIPATTAIKGSQTFPKTNELIEKTFKEIQSGGRIQKFAPINFKDRERNAGKIGILASDEDTENLVKEKDPDIKIYSPE
jgi:hypothetical protein